ncbi:MAG: methyltransferase domain-containing protein [Microcystis aeruginosa L211-101]|jgi:2-polyprenyl-3-methyl-5-hydroxy-6-metoxy-1,4-benzoquinol methylase|nr:methyltransferase domain-containing protein [Microcystis aeruginosa L211-11]NCR31003.1 methyltransferase domain-containing protein [Microcystis aeruginosa L211-101]NCT46164.1 methyltransferase domain-containing protein [Microcystis aeruginosa G11-09]
MHIVCPLSGSANLVLRETIEVKALIKLYSRWGGVDISSEFLDLETINFYHCLDSDLKFFHPLVTGSESFYQELQKFNWYYMDDKEEYDYACRYIKDNDIILEVGCGKGAFSRKIQTSSYTGLEFSKDAIEIASKASIKIINQSVEIHSNSHLESYDVVCSFQVLEHVSNPKSFIESCLKCLKKGGLLIISVPSDDSFIGSLKNNVLNMPPHHVTRWSDKALQYVADRFCLKLIDIHHEKLADIHRRLYARELVIKSLDNLWKNNQSYSLVDSSTNYQVKSKISKVIAAFISAGLTDDRIKPIGHSVTVVYQK